MISFFKKVWDTIGIWVLISPFIIVPLVLIIFSIVGTVSELSKPKDGSVNDAYIEAYNDGYFDGRDWAQEQIAYFVENEYSDMYSSDFEDTICFLQIYADGIYEDEFGEPISEAELQEAIWKLLEHREEVEELIYDIDEIELY